MPLRSPTAVFTRSSTRPVDRLWGGKTSCRGQLGDAYAMLDVLWLFLTAVQAAMRPRQDLVLENLLLRHQLAMLTRPTRRRSHARLRPWDKLVWILARRFCADWREHLAIVTPETVVRWHRQGWSLFWRWKSRSHGGRPHLNPEVRDLIATMSRDNRLWVPNGSEASCSSWASWSAIARFDAIAGVDQAAR
jgi:hypothetical protein